MNLLNISGAFCLLFSVVQAGLCPESYRRIGPAGNKNCYKYVNEFKSWHDARAHCRREGYELVSLEEIEEVPHLTDEEPYNGEIDVRGFWTGAHYGDMGQWRWTSGRAIDLNTFGVKNWNSSAGSEFCATVVGKLEKYYISAVPCTDKRRFTCEAKSGCKISVFLNKYPHLQMKSRYDDRAVHNSVSVKCDKSKGWRDRGSAAGTWSSATCLGENKWQVPQCDKIQCIPPSLIEHQVVTENNVVYNFSDIYSYKCQPGYELNRNVVLPQCVGDGEWSYTNAKCRPVKCAIPDVPNGGHTASNGVTYGETVTFYCSAGYHMLGKPSSRCTETKRLSHTPVCEATICEHLGPLENGIVSQNGGKTASFSCFDHFSMEGSSTLQCVWSEELQRSVWDKARPVCKRAICPPLPPVLHGGYSGQFASGGEVRLSCHPGYHVVGVTSITCFNGHWSTNVYPKCEENTCAELRISEHVIVEDIRVRSPGQYVFGDTVEFACEEGYELDGRTSAVCTAEGRWTTRPPMCQPKPCPMPVTPRNGAKDLTALHYGGMASYRCNPGYILEGNASSECLKDGTWSSVPPLCRACPVGTYRSYNDLNTHCISCPPRSTTMVSASHSRQQCICEAGTEGPPGGLCRARECAAQAPPEHGSKSCSHDAGDEDQCVFSCDPGYKLEGSHVRKCTIDGWSGHPAVCVACPVNTFKVDASNNCIPCPMNTHTAGKQAALQADCVCKPGFISIHGPTSCRDIDECAYENGNCSQGCVNTNGGRQCICTIPGYVLAEDGTTCTRTQTCPDLKDKPKHGYVRCDDIVEENSKICFIGCDAGYFFVSGQNDYLTCGPTTGFVWSHRRSNNTAKPPSCTRKFYVDTAIPMSVSINDANSVCDSVGNSSVTELMWDQLQTVIETLNEGPCHTNNGGLCKPDNFTVSCDGTQKEIEMEFDLVVRNFDSAAVNPNDTRCKPRCERSNLRQMLGRTVRARDALSEALSADFTAEINGTEILFSPRTPVAGRLSLMCAERGRVFTKERLCVPCDKGYYLPNPWMPHCVPCPRGYFQRHEGQTFCDKCLDGSTTIGEGTSHPAQCNIEVETIFINGTEITELRTTQTQTTQSQPTQTTIARSEDSVEEDEVQTPIYS